METPKRPGLTVGARGIRREFTFFANVKPGHEKAIREAIVQAVGDPRTQEAVRKIGTLHEARNVLFDNDTRYMFCSSFDGDWDKYMDDFANSYIAEMFDRILAHGEGWPGFSDPNIKDYLAEHEQEAVTYSCVYPEATVQEILKALALLHAFEQVLDNPEAEQALKSPALKPLLDLAAT